MKPRAESTMGEDVQDEVGKAEKKQNVQGRPCKPVKDLDLNPKNRGI